jgi:hypothetical protein
MLRNIAAAAPAGPVPMTTTRELVVFGIALIGKQKELNNDALL